MPDDSLPQPKSSRLQTTMRLAAWFLPGISAPGLVLIAFLLSYGGSTGDWVIPACFVVLLVFTAGCAVLDAIFRPPPHGETEAARPKRIAAHIAAFIVAQIFLVPAIGITVASGCNAVISSF